MVVINGKSYEPRPLTLPELRKLEGDVAAQEMAAIALTCGLDVTDVETWYNTEAAGRVLAVVKAVYAASGIGEDATKSVATADGAGVARAE